MAVPSAARQFAWILAGHALFAISALVRGPEAQQQTMYVPPGRGARPSKRVPAQDVGTAKRRYLQVQFHLVDLGPGRRQPMDGP
jgi:hypothetical protein